MQDLSKKINTMMLFLKSIERGFFVDDDHYLIFNRNKGTWSDDRGQAITDTDVVSFASEKLYGDLRNDVRRKLENDLINDACRRNDMSWCINDAW